MCGFRYLLIFAFNLILFPTQIVQGNVIVNIFIHYTGFVFGIGTAQLIWQTHKPQQKPHEVFSIDKGKIKSFTEEDRGENSLEHFC